MYHPTVADIDTDVSYPRPLVGVLEEHEVAWLGLGLAHGRADVVKPLRRQSAYAPADAAVVDDPRDKTGTVEGRGRTAAAPDVGVADVLLSFLHHRCKLLVLQRLGRYLIRGLRVGVRADVAGVREQVGSVAQRTHIHGVERELFLGEDIYGQVREVEVLQRDGADGVFILALAVGLDGLSQDVLAVKEGAEHGFCLVHRPLPAEPRGEDGYEHIGVVLNVVDVHVVLVVVVRGLVAVEVCLQLGLHRRVRRLSREHILV